MSDIQSKITKHLKKQENTFQKGMKRSQTNESDPELTKMLELLEKLVFKSYYQCILDI